MASITLISAYLLDIILGDPQRFPHPVRLIGRFIVFLENLFWRANSSPLSQKISGILLALIVVGSTFMATTFLIYWAGYFSQAASFILSIFMGYFTLATRDLHVETRRVLKALEAGNLARARQELSFLVGRDTAHLSEPEVIRALVETIAENLSDGVIAPLFYLGLGGPPWAMTYKAINTLDSMVGYKKERFRHMGWASARLDDAANFIPARLSGGLVVISAFLLGKPWRDSLEILRRDRRQHQSPNSAWPEAATAGALGVQLGGLNYYGGQPSPKPFIGNRKKDLDLGDVRDAWKILYLSSFGMLLLALLLNWAMEGFFCLR
ncbi:MAG: adenosylcobinamide-phosphate synthase CbiB [Deltaproteobacteria bacterium]|nr:adenosylcobinamide-phosphate synthase CbiB [Deltaproteobacteria bacterium]